MIQINNTELFSYFRSDSELKEIFKCLGTNLNITRHSIIMEVLKNLKHLAPYSFSKETQLEYLNLISNFSKQYLISNNNINNNVDVNIRSDEIDSNKIIATLIRNCIYIFDRKGNDSQVGSVAESNSKVKEVPIWEPIIQPFLKNPDQRISSNALITISELSERNLDFKEFIRSPQNRLATDALIEEGKIEFNKYVFNELQEFLKSENPLFVASGLYAASQLYCYYKKSDPIYFQANDYLKRIPEILKKYLNHSNDQIKNRAVIANAEISAT